MLIQTKIFAIGVILEENLGHFPAIFQRFPSFPMVVLTLFIEHLCSEHCAKLVSSFSVR